MKWAAIKEKVTNTCSADNQYSHLAIRCEKSPKFKAEIEKLAQSEDLLIKAFAESTLYATQGKWFECQYNWANALVADKIARGKLSEVPRQMTFYGGTDESFYTKLEALGEFQCAYLKPCEKCKATGAKTPSEVQIGLTNRAAFFFENESLANKDQTVLCETKNCISMNTIEKFKLPANGTKPLWLIVKKQR